MTKFTRGESNGPLLAVPYPVRQMDKSVADQQEVGNQEPDELVLSRLRSTLGGSARVGSTG